MTAKLFCILWVTALVFALFASVLPFPFSIGYDERRWVLVGATIFVTLAYVIRRIFDSACPRLTDFIVAADSRALITVPLSLTLATALASAVTSSLPPFSSAQLLAETFFIIAIGCAAVMLSCPCSSVRVVFSWQRWILDATSLLVSLYSLLAIMGLAFWYSGAVGGFDVYLPWGFYNIRHWSYCASWLLPVVATAIAVRRKEWRKWQYGVALFGLCFWWFMIFGTSARGSAVALVASAMFVASLVRRRDIRSLFVIQIHGFVGGLILWALLARLVPMLLGLENLGSDLVRSGGSGRLALWAEAWGMSFANFPFGLGPLAYAAVTEESMLGAPHSIVLLWAAEYGWLAVAFFCVPVLMIVATFIKKARRPEVASSQLLILVGLGWSVAAALAHSLVSGVFRTPASMLVGLVCIAAFLACLRGCQPEADRLQESRSRWPQYVRWLLLPTWALAASLYAGWTYQFWAAMEADIPAYYEEEKRALAPRFWLHGRFPR